MAVGFGSMEPLRYGTDFRAASRGDGELRSAALFHRWPKTTAPWWIHWIGKMR
jgi:hypothetical protein